MEIADAETGRRVLVDTGSRDVRDRLRTLAEKRRADRARLLGAAGVDQIVLRTDLPYALPLRHAFALRARRLRRG